MALKAPYLLSFRHKKRRPWTSLIDHLVEPGGFEPASDEVALRNRTVGSRDQHCPL